MVLILLYFKGRQFVFALLLFGSLLYLAFLKAFLSGIKQFISVWMFFLFKGWPSFTAFPRIFVSVLWRASRIVVSKLSLAASIPSTNYTPLGVFPSSTFTLILNLPACVITFVLLSFTSLRLRLMFQRSSVRFALSRSAFGVFVMGCPILIGHG